MNIPGLGGKFEYRDGRLPPAWLAAKLFGFYISCDLKVHEDYYLQRTQRQTLAKC